MPQKKCAFYEMCVTLFGFCHLYFAGKQQLQFSRIHRMRAAAPQMQQLVPRAMAWRIPCADVARECELLCNSTIKSIMRHSLPCLILSMPLKYKEAMQCSGRFDGDSAQKLADWQVQFEACLRGIAAPVTHLLGN
jgi:hypothetical protein